MMAPFPPALDAPALDHHMFQVVLGARLSSVKKGSEMFPDVPPPFQLPFGRKKNHFSARPLWFPLPNDVSIKKKGGNQEEEEEEEKNLFVRTMGLVVIEKHSSARYDPRENGYVPQEGE